MGDLDLVWVRSYSLNGREVLTLARESAPTKWLTAADVREILGDEPPVIACDDSGPGGALIFPTDGRRHAASGQPLDVMLAEQLRTAIRRKAMPCPAESFPEPTDFAEPVGGEAARVASEEAAWEAQIRAATCAPVASHADADHHRYGGWKSGDRFVINDPDDAARFAAALHLWPTWGGKASGHVITRCDMHHGGHDVSAGLLIDCEGLPRPVVVSPRVLSACARKVGA